MDTGTIIGIAIGVVGLLLGIAFGLDGRHSAKKTQAKLDALLRLIREANPDAVAAVVAEAAPLEVEPADLQKQRERLTEAITHLPEREKLMVTLYYYEGLALPEIAKVLGTTPEEASALHANAIERLRTALKDGGNGMWVDFW